MNQIEKIDKENALSYIPRELINEVENSIRMRHKKAQSKKTNPNHIKQKDGMDYVEFSYMRNEVDENYPIWSLVDLKFYTEFISTGWVMVQGTLIWMEDGIIRKGSHAAAHRIQFKKGLPRTAENIVDLGNDVKAAVTDLLKKCFNTYLGISDDVYKNITIEPCDETHFKYALSLTSYVKENVKEKFKKIITDEFNSGKINLTNFDKFILSLKNNILKFFKTDEKDVIDRFKSFTYEQYIRETNGEIEVNE